MGIKIFFTDMPLNFDKYENFIVDIFKKHHIEVEISPTPDFLFYSVYGYEHYKYSKCVKVFWTVEPIIPNFNECDYAVGFDDITFGCRYMKRPIWMFEECPLTFPSDDTAFLDRKFCNFIYSNDSNGEGAHLRKELAQKLMKYKKVDCPGRVLNNMQNAITPRDGDWKRGKLAFIQQYKFTIAFENTMYPGYTTEKLTQPLMMHSMPIYWGNPDVGECFNTDAFVLCNGYENRLDEIVDRIIQLDRDDELYLSMMKNNCMTDNYDSHDKEKLEDFLISIVKRGNSEYNKDPLLYNCASKLYIDRAQSTFKGRIKRILRG